MTIRLARTVILLHINLIDKNPDRNLDSNRGRKTAVQSFARHIVLSATAIHSSIETPGSSSISGYLWDIHVGRPDFVSSNLLLLVMCRDDLAHGLLEMKRSLLHLRVELAVDEDPRVEVLLGVDTKDLVLGHDTLIHVTNQGEVFVRGLFVAIDLVTHDRLGRADWGEPLHEEEIGSVGLT